ncbi:hypothetical protein GCM10009745_43850 [Kribbella yunnanensis]|uniref:DUF222 domain-containing protein n=1 Tax=Kribbella yunnanensis TaxID=190194 RepID=A0ABN2HU08_9ACTN
MTTRSLCATDEELLAGYLAGQPDLSPPPEQWPDYPDSPPPDDVYDPDAPSAPVVLSVEDLFDIPLRANKVDELEWELWSGADQDEAEREMLRRCAPSWVFLPPGGDLAAELEAVRPQAETPVALIELMKAAARMASWAESIKATAVASFFQQRKAQHAEAPRPAQIDSSGRPVDPERSWAAEVGAALRLSADTATRHIETALHLTGPLSATLTGLRSGALSWSKALSISEATRSLSDESAKAVEAHVLRRAASQTHANLRRSLRQQVAKHAAESEANQHREAVRERTCKIVPLTGGMAGLWIVHEADKIQQMWVVIQAMADLAKRPGNTGPSTDTSASTDTGAASNSGAASNRGAATDSGAATSAGMAAGTTATNVGTSSNTAASNTGPSSNIDISCQTDTATNRAATDCSTVGSNDADGDADSDDAVSNSSGSPGASVDAGDLKPRRDERTAGQRRADVAADVFEYMLHNGLDWLGRRLPDQHRRRPHIEVLIPASTLLGMDDDPCELSGYGPITAEMARRIAADGTWRRLLTDPANGVVLEASTTRHEPGSLVSETLLARHPVCAWPGCNRASRECDRDHGTRFVISGTTSLAGLAPYCEYHHVIKDTPAWGWHTDNHPDGSITLTTPTGHRYTTVPPARGPIQPRRPIDDNEQQPDSVDRAASPDPPPY